MLSKSFGGPGGRVTKAVLGASLPALGQQGGILFAGQLGLACVDGIPLVFCQKGPLRWSNYASD